MTRVEAASATPSGTAAPGGDAAAGRVTLYLLLTVVAGAAGMLSFAALRDLAELCGFTPTLAWLLPVVVDAGAAAGSLVWLGHTSTAHARRFARRLALGLLGLSVAANALGHGLAAYRLAPPWWVVVILSGIAPAVLGAMVHLAVLVGRPPQPRLEPAPGGPDQPAVPAEPGTPAAGTDTLGDATAWSSPPFGADWPAARWAPTDWPPLHWAPLGPTTGRPSVDDSPTVELTVSPTLADPAPADRVANGVVPDAERAAVLIAAGAGRRRLSRELGVTEYEARRLLEQARPDTDTPAADVAAAVPVRTGAGS